MNTILHGDCLDMLQRYVPDQAINLIPTSPPYGNQRKHSYGGVEPAKYVPWFLKRAEEFERVLAPDGSLHLQYHWCLGVGYQNARCHSNGKNGFTGTWTPILVFSKGLLVKRSKATPLDFLSVSVSDKRNVHPWQKEGEPARYWLERLTLPGDVILDPLSGSGQFAIEALLLGGRKVIACDIDPKAAEITRKRLAEVGACKSMPVEPQ
jgi:DNA modification methylase